MEINNNVFVVTGGGSGLGAATARMIVARGGKVVLADVNKEAGEALAAELGANARFVATDVSSEESAKGAFAAAVELGTLRGLVNCAGVAPAEKVVGREGPHKLESFARTININLVGSFRCIAKFTEGVLTADPIDADGQRGVIINTASVAAQDGQIGQAAYTASKAGVLGMTLPIARDLMNEGVRVNTILPGIFETPMMKSLPEPAQIALAAAVPFPKRLGKPEEYAKTALFLIEHDYINAEYVRMDGGVRMGPK